MCITKSIPVNLLLYSIYLDYKIITIHETKIKAERERNKEIKIVIIMKSN